MLAAAVPDRSWNIAKPCSGNQRLSSSRRREIIHDSLDEKRSDQSPSAFLEQANSAFLEGVRQVAESAVTTAERLGDMFQEYRSRIEGAGRRAGSALRVHETLKARPIQSVSSVCIGTGLSFPAVSSAMDLMAELGIARELTGKRRNRLFLYDRYIAILNEGTEPL